ncbi:MAG: hypothetical protein M1484_02910 [Patescibacteria group bacterium]|nr:hypothetical protein [Patescibacteria group bacterium]
MLPEPPPISQPEVLNRTGLPSDILYEPPPEVLLPPPERLLFAISLIKDRKIKNHWWAKPLAGLITILAATTLQPSTVGMANELQTPISAPAEASTIANFIPAPPEKLEATAEAKIGASVQETIAETYNMPKDKMASMAAAIEKVESQGKTDNPMQVLPDTGAESLADFKSIVKAETFNRLTAGMTARQKQIMAGEITFARYRLMLNHTLDDFSLATKDDLALAYYNGGPGFTGRAVLFFTAKNPGLDLSRVTWRQIHDCLTTNSAEFGRKFNLPPQRGKQWADHVDTYITRVKLALDSQK